MPFLVMVSKYPPPMKSILTTILFALVLAVLSACGDADNLYATGHRAYFQYDRVRTATPLYTAVSNPGMWCAVSTRNGQYVFTGSGGITATDAITDMDRRKGYECLAGFIVGRPSVPDLTGSTLVAYDLVCRACYEEHSLLRALTFSAAEQVRCGRCGRTYDLSSGGHAISGEGAYTLYRYHATYGDNASGTLTITN